MTVDTEAKAVQFMTAARLEFFRTGSRETCNPTPMNTDVDFLVLIDPSRRLPEQYDETFEKAGFRHTSADHGETYGSNGDDFETYRCGEVNLIVVWDRLSYNNWRGATSIAKRLNLLEKAHRIALFQGILYCNWAEWLAIDHSGDIPL